MMYDIGEIAPKSEIIHHPSYLKKIYLQFAEGTC
jgi:hypothetical protein